MIDGQHELVRLAALIDWSWFEEHWAGFFPSPEGRPALHPRLVAGLMYLQHAHGLSDEAVLARWVENPYYQHFTGEVFFQHRLPLHALVHVWTAPGAQGLLRDLARGTSAVMCPAYNAADDRWPRWVSPSRPPNTDAASMSPCTKRGFLFVGSTGCHLLRLPFCSSAVTNG